MIKQTKLAASITVALGASAIATGAAVAGTGFWPHVVYSPSVTTVVSVINQNQSGDDLHYVLYYKDATDNTAACQEVNVFKPTSPNDIQTIDLGAVFGSTTKGVLFNDPSVNNDWDADPRTFALAQAAGQNPLRGYLLVDNSGTTATDVSGDALVLEYTNGATWGYKAEESFNSDFRNSGLTIGIDDVSQVSIKPFAEINTSFMVTPVSANMGALDGTGGDDSVTLRMRVQANGITGVMYDRDENPVSGAAEAPVVCVGRVNATELVGAGAQTFLPDGGWSNLEILPNAAGIVAGTTGAVVYQLEYGSGTFNGETMSGTFNNSFELK
ncbi:hypothetical protein CKO42_04435 [Lamprobacter modestohalophilus]|uniref:Uncharacterized protein n=1 Tax=Lamprobacter modestohalophilus TaxID=1064514 RepID=A0A9X0W636_9GAMM|nr:hypothetical protein [Lamprobacter modestohalophilus]MBK1617712.1 hypothetical protein [Lamprobacter modestohalophilus]